MIVWVVIEFSNDFLFYFNLYACVTQTSLVMKNLNAPCMKYVSLFAAIFAECLKNEPVTIIFSFFSYTINEH